MIAKSELVQLVRRPAVRDPLLLKDDGMGARGSSSTLRQASWCRAAETRTGERRLRVFVKMVRTAGSAADIRRSERAHFAYVAQRKMAATRKRRKTLPWRIPAAIARQEKPDLTGACGAGILSAISTA